MNIDLETILAIVISLITVQLLFIGFYIVSVLREVKKTVQRAEEVIDEVDRTVKDSTEKMVAMERPLRALATTTAAVGGLIRGASAVRKATQSILGAVEEAESEIDSSGKDEKPEKPSKPRFFHRDPK